ncbi:MAG: Hsp20 family protein [Methyloligellaceae bacterium]
MSRISLLNNPLLLGFEEIERALDKVSRTAEGYPPYNIERIPGDDGDEGILRITLAVAGFRRDELEVTVEDRQLYVRGRQVDEGEKHYLHRGIAARQFQRTFVLADGIEVIGADLENGLLTIDLTRPTAEALVQKIEISQND